MENKKEISEASEWFLTIFLIVVFSLLILAVYAAFSHGVSVSHGGF